MKSRGMIAFAFLAACGKTSQPATRPVSMTIKSINGNEAPITVAPVDQDPPEAPVQITLATNRLCARIDGRVYCQPQAIAEQPIAQDKYRIPGVDDAIDLSGSRSVICVVTRRGTVMCAGQNDYGVLGAQLTNDRSDAFVEVTGVTHAKRVSAGTFHACATLDDKSVKCWGKNEHGQTGSDTYYHPFAKQLVKATVVPNVKSDNVVAGNDSSCARSVERQVICWGLQVDHDANPSRGGVWTNERPIRIPDLDDIGALYGHDEGFCAIRRGRVLCWGNARRLIPGTDYFGSGIVSLAEIKDAQQVALSDGHGCVLHSDGRVSCFGYPYTYALGRSAPTDPQKEYDAAPAAIVEGLPRARFVAAGGTQSCALTYSNDLYCWGRWYTESGTHDEVRPIAVQLR